MGAPRLHGVRAIVTGASRGVGRAVAEAFVAEGAHVVGTAREAGRLDAFLRAARGPGDPPSGVVLDLADPGGVAAAARAAILALGRVDVLVNNAGMLGSRVPLEDVPPGELEAVVAANLVGTLRFTQAILPAMGHGGAIVNVSSGAAGRAGWAGYGVTKAAMDAATRMLREELADRGIRCVAVNPGGTRTAMRAAAYPHEDPATVPHPRGVVPPFVAIAEGADPGWHVEAREWTG
ncbi:MAG: SDR family oxidoreductase [Thermoleophilia bacterium]|nr:SDR family oxidoreductase [Thermoleophilia bacterium]